MKVDKVGLYNSSVKSLQWKLKKVVLIPDIYYSTQYFWFLHTMTNIENEWRIVKYPTATLEDHAIIVYSAYIYLHVYNYVESSLKYIPNK